MDDTSTTPLTAPTTGTRVGRYTLHDSVGRGATASVYRAVADDGQQVAVKVLHPDAIEPDDVKRFEREFRTLARLEHPNIIRVYEAGRHGIYPWIAMEYVDGDDLGTAMGQWKLPPGPDKMPDVLRFARGLCAGLAYIHERGLIHRDLKPANVLLTTDKVPKITDFGVVKDPYANGTVLTMAGRLVGTVAFMAPEQITNDPVDARTDLYSFGAMLFLLLTGRRPIEAKSIAAFLARHLTEVPKTANHYNPAVPPHLSQLCARLLAKDPAERPASAAEVLQLLDEPSEDRPPPLRSRDAAMTPVLAALRTVRDGAATALCLVGPPGSGRTAMLDATARAAEALELDVLRYSRSNPPARLQADVVLIDDAQRLSADAVRRLNEQLDDVLSDGRGLCIVCAGTSARGVLTPLGQALARPPQIVALPPLSRPDVIGMMRDRGLAGPVAPLLGRRLHEAFGGLPGPIDAQVRALVEADWFRRDGDRLRADRLLDDYRTGELVVPTAVRNRIQTQLSALEPTALDLCRLLTTFDRPMSDDLLQRACGQRDAATALVDLLDRGLLLRDSDAVSVRFAHPSTPVVMRSRMSDEQRQQLALRAADALQRRRRRADAPELARMWVRGGAPDKAYPSFVRAGRRAARDGRFAEVLALVDEAQAIQKQAERALDSTSTIRYRRWLWLLRGEAQLARGAWKEAVEPLTNAVAASRLEGDSAATARALTSLGRAHYRAGAFDAAAPVLEEAITVADPGDPMRASATRALADIRLRQCDTRGAERLWTDALELARVSGSGDGEARAVRGLAHVRALQNRLDTAASLLESALDRFDRTGDARVRCGVLARAVELDLAAGRLGAASHRTEQLLSAVEHHELADRIADVWVLRAIVLLEIGRPEDAVTAANTALTYSQVHVSTAWNIRLRAARVLVSAGQPEAAAKALPGPDDLPPSRVEDPAGQLAALRARLLAPTDPEAAKDLATWAITRPEPLLVLRGFRIRVDAARALTTAGAIEHAREAAKRAVRMLDSAGTEGFRLEALLALHHASPDPRVADACGQLARRIAERLGPSIAETYRQRKDLVAIGAFADS